MDSAAPLGEQALEYADVYGYEVFPLVPRGEFAKSPGTSNGMLDATTDLNRIRDWWEARPDALIGHRVPPEELILDVDPRHGGMEVFKALKAEIGLHTSRVHISGRGDGGGHLHFLRPEGRLSTKKLALWAKERGLGEDLGADRWSPGIDLLHHDHRYTILPPSPHPDTGEPYFWRGRGPEDPPASLPEKLVELLLAPEATERPPPGPYDPNSIADWFSATQGFSWLAEKAWVLVHGDGSSDGSAWRHPLATNSISATVRHGCLFVYSENTSFEVTMPGDPAGYTPFRAWAILCHGGNLSVAAGEARLLKERLDQAAAANGAAPVGLAGVVPRHVRWLWHPFLPLGKMVIHAGEPGLMKSSFDVAIAALITNGKGFAESFGPQNVVFLNFEDDDEDGLVPRLIAAGADLDRCFSVPDDAGAQGLEKIVRAVRPIGVFVDPFGSWAEATENTGIETQVRKSLKPLRQLARSTGAMVKVNCHPNKQNSLSDALYRISGSLGGMVGFARVVLASKRQDDHYVAGIVKSNVGPDELGIEYFSQFVPVKLSDGTEKYPRVMFGDTVTIDRKNFFAGESERKVSRAQECAEEILRLMDGQIRYAEEMNTELFKLGFQKQNIIDGRRAAGVETIGPGKNARWHPPRCDCSLHPLSNDTESEGPSTEGEASQGVSDSVPPGASQTEDGVV